MSVLTLAITISLNLSCEDSTSPEITEFFGDPNFETLIREALDKPSGEITIEDLSSITLLDGIGREITSISGIEFIVNITEINLDSNSISDITPLSELTNLTELNLDNNLFSDISSISGLTKLKSLNLDSNQIKNIASLSGLTNLTSLDLEDNQIVDIKPLVDNTGLGSGDTIALNSNPLSNTSITVYIPQLKANGVDVIWE